MRSSETLLRNRGDKDIFTVADAGSADVRRAGWIFLAIFFAAGLLTEVFGRENLWLMATFLIALVLGLALLASSFAARLYRGDVKLRPWDAARKAVVIFAILLAARLLIEAAFPSRDFDLTEVIAISAAFALFFSLDTTAYRKPA